jgi:hypothetical protein
MCINRLRIMILSCILLPALIILMCCDQNFSFVSPSSRLAIGVTRVCFTRSSCPASQLRDRKSVGYGRFFPLPFQIIIYCLDIRQSIIKSRNNVWSLGDSRWLWSIVSKSVALLDSCVYFSDMLPSM